MAGSAQVGSTLAPAILQSSVDVRPLRTRIRSFNTSPLFAHVAGLASKVVFAVADLISDLREVRTGRGSSDIETVILKEVTVLVVKTHLVDWTAQTAETLGSFVSNLHMFAIVGWRLAQVG